MLHLNGYNEKLFVFLARGEQPFENFEFFFFAYSESPMFKTYKSEEISENKFKKVTKLFYDSKIGLRPKMFGKCLLLVRKLTFYDVVKNTKRR